MNHKNIDAHFLNRNYGRTGRADVQTDQQHSTSCVLNLLTHGMSHTMLCNAMLIV
jgi:hypothetical protein